MSHRETDIRPAITPTRHRGLRIRRLPRATQERLTEAMDGAILLRHRDPERDSRAAADTGAQHPAPALPDVHHTPDHLAQEAVTRAHPEAARPAEDQAAVSQVHAVPDTARSRRVRPADSPAAAGQEQRNNF